MKFFMEKNKEAGHRVTINIPKTTVNNAIVKELMNISKKTHINGFRKGKTPIKVVQEKYGDSVYYDVFKELMQKFFYKFIHKEKIKIIGWPKYYMHKNEDKKKECFEYSVIYELHPKFQMEDIKKITAKKIKVTITDQDIKKNYKTKTDIWNSVNRSIKYYDRVTINYSIYENNKEIKRFDRENISFIVSNNTFIPQLNNRIVNHVINDIIFLKIKFHQFYPEKELQNKDITFKIKIIKIEKKQEQEFEENTKNNTKEEKLNYLNFEIVKKNISSQIKKITEKYLEDQIIQEIVKKNIIIIPPILFQEEIKIIYKQYQQQYYKEKIPNILEKKYHINLDSQVKKRLSIRIIIEKIISDNQLCANEDNIQLLIKKISLNYKQPIEIINLYNKNKELKNKIKNIDLENQAMSLLKKNIKTVKQNWTFDQFINYNWKDYEELMT